MAEVLKEWLTQRLQIQINWEAEELGSKMKDGYIIAGVLKSYNIINDEKHFLIRSSLLDQDIKNNWRLIREWLRDIEINLSDIDIASITEGKGTTLLRLFYQMFLHLDKLDRTNFIKRERKMASRLVEKMEHRFNVKGVPEVKESVVDNLSKPILDEKLFIEWQQKKTKQVKETYDYIRHKYSKMLYKIDESKTPLQHPPLTPKKISIKDKKDMEVFSQRYPCQFENFSYADLLVLEQKTVERKQSLVDTEWAKGYMDNLYKRIHKKDDSEEFQKQIIHEVSGSLWDISLGGEESMLDSDLSKKVMKLSQFEKQMCTQIMETKQQGRNLIKNRMVAEAEYAQERTHNFNQYLDTLKEEINLGLVEIDFEKQRQDNLHKSLYAEKMKRKRQHYYEICYDTVLSLIDYATKYAYFKRLIGDDIPSHFIHEWKTLYYKQQPIFDILHPMEDIIKEPRLEEEFGPEEEEIVRYELIRQESLNDTEFVEYHSYLPPWSLGILIPNYDPESEERKYEYLGTRILGHVVYTLLQIKYPYPPQRPPADLPYFSVKALLVGLPDRYITVPMQKLLNDRKILVVRLETAINFCLKQFKTEMVGCTDIELSYDKFIAAAQEDEPKELIRLMKVEEETSSKSTDLNVQVVLGPIPANTKQTQTPKTIPEEEIVLSSSAELGNYAYKALSFGDSLTDYLLAAMIVEYVKYQKDINGFVIINYPNSYREAQILEETFSGRAPPDEGELNDSDDIYLEESICKHRKKEKDPYKEIRVSNLVINPHKRKIEMPFVSYFTCYLKLKGTEDILQEIVIWYLTEENSEFIDRFYAVLGINYSMYFEVIEKEQLALICKYIIGDLSIPMKSNNAFFGENVLSLLEFPSSDDKRTKSKIIKPEVSSIKSKERLRRSSKFSKSSDYNLEVVKAPDSSEGNNYESLSTENILHEEHETKTTHSEASGDEIKLMAGEEDWDYGEMPIAEIIGVALATCWEEIEKTYINDMKQLFFAKRLQMNCLVPYTRFLKDKMEQIITLPSRKQDLVTAFQNKYNEFESDWRDINSTKNEWHCRVKELQNTLYTICDERKQFAEQQRHSLICENWAMEELTTMANTYISCMQTELNRFILTYQTLHDFYFAMIKKSPANDRLLSKDLTKIVKDTDETSGSKKGGEDKLYRQLKNAYMDLLLRNVAIDFSNNPLNMIIENNIKFSLKVIKDMNDSYRSLISREYSEIAKLVIPTRRKDDITSNISINPEEMFKQNALQCIEEWSMGINGEMFRANLRLLALQYKCQQDMILFSGQISNAFTTIQDYINTYYLNEIESVNRLCKYLQMSVEDGKKIPEVLLLEHDNFIIDPNILLFFVPPPKFVEKKKDFSMNMDFKIQQLARLRSQFKIVAPAGIALQQAFIFVLQDFIFFGKESIEGPIFPEAWKRIDVEKVPKFVFLVFGETVYVDWRDFLIYCLHIRFPSVEELIEIRKKYRCNDLESTELISRDDFINVPLWFEQDLNVRDCSSIRTTLLKHFLFELFESGENVMNYSAFLLAFCKNIDPVEGFAMALSMAVGKKICFCLDECKEVICKLIRDKRYKEESLACARKCTEQCLDKVITNVVNICESTTIQELAFTAPSPEVSKKGQKSKVLGSKAKKKESTLSARLPKLEKNLTSRTKVSQSESDIKTTFICRPCEDADVISDKPAEKVEPDQDQNIEPKPDPNIAYAVPQSCIWNVLQTCLPWHFQLLPEERVTPYVEQIAEVMKYLEVDTEEKDIYVSKFVLDPRVCQILHKVKKFVAIDLVEELLEVSV